MPPDRDSTTWKNGRKDSHLQSLTILHRLVESGVFHGFTTQKPMSVEVASLRQVPMQIIEGIANGTRFWSPALSVSQALAIKIRYALIRNAREAFRWVAKGEYPFGFQTNVLVTKEITEKDEHRARTESMRTRRVVCRCAVAIG